jgi:hypothetical protein
VFQPRSLFNPRSLSASAVKVSRCQIVTVISRQSSPPFACAPSHIAHDPSPLYSPSLHPNLTHPHHLSRAHSTTSPLLTPLAWDVVIPGRATVESVNFWREGFRGARIGSGGPSWAPGIRMGSRSHYPSVVYQCYYRGGVGILPCNALLILLSAAIFFLKFSSLARSPYYSISTIPLCLQRSTLFIIGIPIYQASDTKNFSHSVHSKPSLFYLESPGIFRSQSRETTVPRWARKRQQRRR